MKLHLKTHQNSSGNICLFQVLNDIAIGYLFALLIIDSWNFLSLFGITTPSTEIIHSTLAAQVVPDTCLLGCINNNIWGFDCSNGESYLIYRYLQMETREAGHFVEFHYSTCQIDCNLDQKIKVLRFARIGNRIVTKGLRPLSVS